MSGWELDCCGNAFAVDETVSWETALLLPEWSALYSEFGKPVLRGQARHQERHDDTSGSITGVIRAIYGINWQYQECEQQVEGPVRRVLIPATGTATSCNVVLSSDDFVDFLVDIETTE